MISILFKGRADVTWAFFILAFPVYFILFFIFFNALNYTERNFKHFSFYVGMLVICIMRVFQM